MLKIKTILQYILYCVHNYIHYTCINTAIHDTPTDVFRCGVNLTFEIRSTYILCNIFLAKQKENHILHFTIIFYF